MINILIVEDDLDLAATLVEYLEMEGMVCDHARDGVLGLALAEQHHFDVVLLDINLPKMDGLTVCQLLRQKGVDTPVLMMTARDQLNDKIDGFRVGTDDYLVKPFELKELSLRVSALARRRSGQSKLLQYKGLEMNLNDHCAKRDGNELRLSPTAWRLLETLLRYAPDAVSRQALAQSVWGDDVPDSNSLKVHIFHLRKIVDEPYATTLIQTVSRYGFALKEENEN